MSAGCDLTSMTSTPNGIRLLVTCRRYCDGDRIYWEPLRSSTTNGTTRRPRWRFNLSSRVPCRSTWPVAGFASQTSAKLQTIWPSTLLLIASEY